MIHNLGEKNSLVTQIIGELRDVTVQGDRMRFRKNLERLGMIMAYEISQVLPYVNRDIKTPLGVAPTQVLKEQPVLGTILRAGLGLHQGLLDFFDMADNAFISAYRKHKPDGSFEIELEYVSCPNLQNRILIVSDPMLATGASIAQTLRALFANGKPRQTHVVVAIGSTAGVERVTAELPDVHIWAGAIDKILNDKAYIVPGLGDAGDLAYGWKMQA